MYNEIPIFSPYQVLEIASSFVLAYAESKCSHDGAVKKLCWSAVVV